MCAKLASSAARLYLDEFNISGSINSFDLGFDQERALVTTLSDDGPRRVVGNYDHRFGSNGFFDGDSGAFDAQAFSNFRTDEDHYLSSVFGLTEGSPAYLDVIRAMDQPRSGGVGGAVLLNLSGEGSGARSRGMLLRSATLVAAGNGTGRNMGATASGILFAVHFHLLAFSGTNITLTVEESSDDAAADPYALIAGLTSGALTGVNIVRATTTAATEAWKRLVAAGTFVSATVLVTAGS